MLSMRLGGATEAKLKKLAERRGQSQEEVVRAAIDHLAQTESSGASAFQLLQPFIGVADSGGLQLSRESGKRVRQMLEEKRRARRAG